MQVEEQCGSLWPTKLLAMQELSSVRIWEVLDGALSGADMQLLFGLRDRWESDLGTNLQAMGRECIGPAKEASGIIEQAGLLLSLAEQHPRMSIYRADFVNSPRVQITDQQTHPDGHCCLLDICIIY